ncbi:hypothetical protein [Thalassobacillus sp. C254]|uniref:hypothetical protein n=1 Tax=Thalassobacillus sp. C254 TaxID=1225341 RepID=UPI0006D0F661|nr:hypothetical protein [Thalassobacillus sp. C254]
MAKKLVMFSSIATAVAGIVAYVMKNEERKEKVMHASQRLVAKAKGQAKEDEDEELNEKVGHSDPYDIDDNNMVAEGAQTSVFHYNKAQDREDEDPAKSPAGAKVSDV